jgi:hypothetical protein
MVDRVRCAQFFFNENCCGVVEIWHADLEGFKGWEN